MGRTTGARHRVVLELKVSSTNPIYMNSEGVRLKGRVQKLFVIPTVKALHDAIDAPVANDGDASRERGSVCLQQLIATSDRNLTGPQTLQSRFSEFAAHRTLLHRRLTALL